ncbi:MAG TPA: hypothetical protein VHH73_17890, partial [Verrucomicrobiae bacterium]|nr:hypothetical protein [Verrucomicrobiae bacterium]
MESSIQSRLEAILREQRRLRLWRALAGCWLATGLFTLGLIFVYRMTHWGLPFASLLLLVGGAIAAWWIKIRVERMPLDLHGVARRIEQENPKLRSLLLAAIEQRPDPVTGQWSYLQQRVIVEAMEADRRSSWGQKTHERIFFAQCAQWAAVVFFLLTLLGLPTPKQVRLASRIVPFGVAVTPGNTTLERGTSLAVLARFDGRLPADVSLVIRASGAQPRRVSLVKNLSDPVFGGSIPDVQGDFTYQIEYGDKHSAEYQVKVFEYPRLERADASLTYPTYTGLGAKRVEDTRRVSAVEGTKLDYAFQLNKPVANARLIAKDKSVLPLAANADRAAAALTNFTLAASRSYELQLVDADGRTNKVPIPITIEVLSNRPPELKLALPKADPRVSPLEEIHFKGEVWDDFGVVNYGMTYSTPGQEPVTVPLGKAIPAKEKKPFEYLLRLEDLKAKADQLISYY